MRITPITEEEAKESAKPNYLLTPGECDFEITAAADQVSSNNNEMIKLTMNVFDVHGKKAIVFDYLLDAIPHKARHAAYAVGLGHQYEDGEIEAASFVGKEGKCLIRLKQQTGYEPKNEVADYIVADESKSATGYKAAKAKDSGKTPPPASGRVQAWKKFQELHKGDNADDIAKSWRLKIKAHFGTAEQKDITNEGWLGFAEKLSQKPRTESPIEEDAGFNADDIPF